ncbi:MAG: LysM peptidoglycan-binding domain-containing protein [Chlorobi bacterium]|nr:LysM peptidoglycan-binding domain-containing protein [Chlorobiota bacterium]
MERQEYIARYSGLAREEMKRTGIPASITMAQALLESDNGNSYLARKGNNHFGIKCHNGWNGRKIFYDDDKRHECFRRYASAEQSFRDHSDFIANGSRYAFLFDLDPRNFKGWAKGLKKAGYATHPHYDKMLIKIIEENRLYELDDRKYTSALPSAKKKSGQPSVTPASALSEPEQFTIKNPGHPVYQNNRIDYIIVRSGDTMESLRKELDLLPWELGKYNELDQNAVLVPGQIIYLQPKRKQAEAGFKTHMVMEGDTMYTISQKYGIRLKSLYELNQIKEGEEPEPGTQIKLRK